MISLLRIRWVWLVVIRNEKYKKNSYPYSILTQHIEKTEAISRIDDVSGNIIPFQIYERYFCGGPFPIQSYNWNYVICFSFFFFRFLKGRFTSKSISTEISLFYPRFTLPEIRISSQNKICFSIDTIKSFKLTSKCQVRHMFCRLFSDLFELELLDGSVWLVLG